MKDVRIIKRYQNRKLYDTFQSCYVTLEEIAQEAQEAYLHAGGKTFHYIACLNNQSSWIEALHSLCMNHMANWPVNGVDETALASSRQEAIALGAQS